MSDEYTTIDLMRHGECEGGHIFRGSGTDVPLSELGWQQMTEALASYSATGENWSQLMSSPLIRCQQFAQKHAGLLNVPLQIQQNLREIHFGVWEGQLIREVWQQSPRLMAAYFKNPQSFTPEGGESILEVKKRLESVWRDVMTQCRGQKLLLVQHGGTIRMLLTMI